MKTFAKSANAIVDPLAMVVRGRNNQRTICDHLEQIADQLGGPIDAGLCQSVLLELENDLPLYQLDEEVFLSVLCQHSEGDQTLAGLCELAIAEHRANETYFFELCEPLNDLGTGGKLYDINTVGYMLRCCFEGLRRHLNWEDVALLSGRLEAVCGPELDLLAAGLARNRSNNVRHLSLSK